MKSSILLSGRGRVNFFNCLHSATYKTATTSDLSKFGNKDVGYLYRIPNEHATSLCFNLVLPKDYNALTSTLQEYVLMFRQQTLEAFNCIQNLQSGQTSPRLLIWGDWGTGKTLTLVQLAHLAFTQNYIIVTITDAMCWARDDYHEMQVSTYKPGRLNIPHWATRMLSLFKQQNQSNWSTLANLKTTKKYEWSQVEQTEKGRPITEIVEIGLSAPYLATDCLCAIYKELRIHSTNGEIKLLVLIDKANGLFGKCIVRRPDRTRV
jgi:hypothetical protein